MSGCKRLEQTLPNGATQGFLNYAGINFPEFYVDFMPAKDLLTQLKWVREAEIFADDVLLMAYSKAGTHWTWELLNMIHKDTTEYRPFTKVGAMIEMMSPEMMSQLSSPRVFNTHLPTSLIPRGIIEKKCKIVHVMRNPKDICTSFYHHFKTMLTNEGLPDLIPSFDGYVRNFQDREGILAFSTYSWHVKQVERFQNDNPDVPLLNLFYEDMKKNPEAEVRKMAQFLGKDIDDLKLREIVQRCAFNNLKQAHLIKEDSLKKISKGSGDFIYRKGGVGDWKNHFTVAQSEEFDKWFEEEMKGSEIKFQYE